MTKSEIRKPKPEGNPKAEIRELNSAQPEPLEGTRRLRGRPSMWKGSTLARGVGRFRVPVSRPIWLPFHPHRAEFRPSRNHALGFRFPAFFRISEFGLRISDALLASSRSFLGKLLEVLLNAPPIRRRQPRRINVGDLRFILLPLHLVGGLHREMLEFVDELSQVLDLNRLLCLQHLVKFRQKLCAAIIVTVLAAHAGLQVAQRLLALLALLLPRELSLVLKLLEQT